MQVKHITFTNSDASRAEVHFEGFSNQQICRYLADYDHRCRLTDTPATPESFVDWVQTFHIVSNQQEIWLVTPAS